MPSRFLETFGLSALTALSRGLPVIGYKKGGLVQFVDEELDLGKFKGNLDEQLYQLISSLGNRQIHPAFGHLPLTRKDVEKYSKESWKKKIQAMIGDKKKILLVSDFVSKVGGIETYIYDVKEILEDLGYEVKLWGTSLPHGI
jgi:hypothetical protein